MIAKPPRAPCWRDFVGDSDDSDTLRQLYFTDLSRLQKPGLQVIQGVGDGFPSPEPSSHSAAVALGPHQTSSNRSGRHGKRLRAKLHRTRSHMLIQEEDLPNGSLTVNLSETKPREFGLNSERRHVHVCDNRRYLEENTKRCQTWLATVEASQPLDDIAFAQGNGVDIEIPEECWDRRADILRPPCNSSASSSDDETALPEVTLPSMPHVSQTQTRNKNGTFSDANRLKLSASSRKLKATSITVNKLKKTSSGRLTDLCCNLEESHSSVR